MAEYFFGESYRIFCDRLHITDAAKLFLILDILKNVAETVFFSSYIGYLDAFIVIHLSWVAFGVCSCVIGFYLQRHHCFWPFLALKITECVTALISLAAILILVVAGTVSNHFLSRLIQWKYPRVEAAETLSFSLLLFAVISVLLIFNCAVLDVFVQTQLYYRRRAMNLYQMEREAILRHILTR